MNHKNIETVAYNFTAPSTTTDRKFNFTPENRHVSHACIVVSGSLPNNIIDISLGYFNGKVVVQPMDIRLWQKSDSGKYMEQFLPVNFDTKGKELTLDFSSATALAADLNFQLVLFYENEETEVC